LNAGDLVLTVEGRADREARLEAAAEVEAQEGRDERKAAARQNRDRDVALNGVEIALEGRRLPIVEQVHLEAEDREVEHHGAADVQHRGAVHALVRVRHPHAVARAHAVLQAQGRRGARRRHHHRPRQDRCTLRHHRESPLDFRLLHSCTAGRNKPESWTRDNRKFFTSRAEIKKKTPASTAGVLGGRYKI
jgi:hypothetical protein